MHVNDGLWGNAGPRGAASREGRCPVGAGSKPTGSQSRVQGGNGRVLRVRCVGERLQEHPIGSQPFLRGRERCWSPRGGAGGGSIGAPSPRVCLCLFCCWNAALLPTGVGNRKVNLRVDVRSRSAARCRWRLRCIAVAKQTQSLVLARRGPVLGVCWCTEGAAGQALLWVLSWAFWRLGVSSYGGGRPGAATLP